MSLVGWQEEHLACKKLKQQWLSVWCEVQMICIWSSWCLCYPIISCSSKIQNGLPFWCGLTQVVLEKKPLNRCSSSSSSGTSNNQYTLGCIKNATSLVNMHCIINIDKLPIFFSSSASRGWYSSSAPDKNVAYAASTNLLYSWNYT